MSGRKGNKQDKNELSGYWRWVQSLGLAAATCLAVVCLNALLIWLGLLPGTGEGGVLLACVLGGFTGGFYLANGTKKAPLPKGVTAGVILMAALFCVGIPVRHGVGAGEGVWPVAAACMCGGALGGILSGLKGKKKKR